MKKLVSSASLCLAVSAAVVVPAVAQVTTRVSVDSNGVQGDAPSYSPSLSADGRFVAIESEASNLVQGDTNDADDIFVHDRQTGATVRVSVDSSGAQSDGDSYAPVLSADGRFVAFYSEATNLVQGDTNGVYDVFVHDILSGATTRVSVDSGGAQADERSFYSSLSADGRFVAFMSLASNLVSGDTNGWSDIFVHDRSTGITSRVSVSSAGGEGNDLSEYPEISADGGRIVFVSRASNLIHGDTNGTSDIFVHDRISGTTVCASLDPNGAPGDGGCGYPSISGNGRIVGFGSNSSNLVAGDTNGLGDVFVHNLATGATTRISVGTNGTESNGYSQLHTPGGLSFTGRCVAFKSFASNLVPNDTNASQDIFFWDRRTSRTTRVSVGPNYVQSSAGSSQPVMSANGRVVGYYSTAANLVPGDTNHVPDVFVRRVR